MTTVDVTPYRSLLTYVNAAIDELQRSLGISESEFFCECGSTLCKERIWLTRAAYASLVEASAPVLAEAHAARSQRSLRETTDERVSEPATA